MSVIVTSAKCSLPQKVQKCAKSWLPCAVLSCVLRQFYALQNWVQFSYPCILDFVVRSQKWQPLNEEKSCILKIQNNCTIFPDPWMCSWTAAECLNLCHPFKWMLLFQELIADWRYHLLCQICTVVQIIPTAMDKQWFSRGGVKQSLD